MKMKHKLMLSLVALSGAAGFQLSVSAARAGETCDTMESSCQLKSDAEAQSATPSKAIVPDLTDLARLSDGTVRRMNQYDAEIYCRNQGMRLPTARELALYSQSLGAQGISETWKEGYYRVKAADEAGHPDIFYFSAKDFQRPTGDVGMFFYWSSSVHLGSSVFAYGFDTHGGVVYPTERIYRNATTGVARCVRPH